MVGKRTFRLAVGSGRAWTPSSLPTATGEAGVLPTADPVCACRSPPAPDILACMQASTAAKQLSGIDELAQGLSALCRHLRTQTGRDFFKAVDELQLTFTQIKAAQILAEADEPVSLGAISERLALSLPAVSRAVDGLVKRGLCTRTEDPADRRSKSILITARGRRLYEQVHEIRIAGIRNFVEELDPAERDALLDGLRPIVRGLS